jgi:hypothetical protein
VPSPTPVPTATPVPSLSPDESGDSTETSNGSADAEDDNRPLIIGIIVGVVVLAAGFYIVLVEIPYRKKKKAYQKKYGRQ